jgi:hypothetical protein
MPVGSPTLYCRTSKLACGQFSSVPPAYVTHSFRSAKPACAAGAAWRGSTYGYPALGEV